MFYEPKGQKHIFVKKNSEFLTPLRPLGVCLYIFEKIVSDLAVCRSNLTHLREETQ